MISHETASILYTQLGIKFSKLVYLPQNLVDLCWVSRPLGSKEPVYIQPLEFTGIESAVKLSELRSWIRKQPAAIAPFVKPTLAEMHVGTLISSLPSIAYILNLRGADMPFTPLFQAFLFVSLEHATLFIDGSKVSVGVHYYLNTLGVERK